MSPALGLIDLTCRYPACLLSRIVNLAALRHIEKAMRRGGAEPFCRRLAQISADQGRSGQIRNSALIFFRIIFFRIEVGF
jgi:hypothetical protein